MINEIKEKYKNLPHIKQVWVRGNEIYLVAVKGANKVDLNEPVTQQVEQDNNETPLKKSKKK